MGAYISVLFPVYIFLILKTKTGMIFCILFWLKDDGHPYNGIPWPSLHLIKYFSTSFLMVI